MLSKTDIVSFIFGSLRIGKKTQELIEKLIASHGNILPDTNWVTEAESVCFLFVKRVISQTESRAEPNDLACFMHRLSGFINQVE